MATSKYFKAGKKSVPTIVARTITKADENVDSESKGRKSSIHMSNCELVMEKINLPIKLSSCSAERISREDVAESTHVCTNDLMGSEISLGGWPFSAISNLFCTR